MHGQQQQPEQQQLQVIRALVAIAPCPQLTNKLAKKNLAQLDSAWGEAQEQLLGRLGSEVAARGGVAEWKGGV